MANTTYEKRIRPGVIAVRALIYTVTAAVVALVVAIIAFLIVKGLPYINWEFLSKAPSRLDETYGIAPMIINTLYIVLLSLIVSIPLGIGTALYLAEYSKPGKVISAIRFAIEILAGIPSIVYGLFGLAFFINALKAGSSGGSMIAGALTCTLIVLPTMIRTTEEALLQVNPSYREAAFSLGASKLHIIRTVLLPCALPGIVVAIILSIGRIVSESAALLYTAGVDYTMPANLVKHVAEPGAGLTVQLYLYATEGGSPDWVPYAMAAVLMILVFIINLSANIIAGLFKKKVSIN
ncbi:phosphate ABC transporter permease PstA [Anaerocolumna xylanovorans]|uniref:Phosphate transport system permease protein PstA n=1 Tax=Anaerocolumna xylanovorans DSM 12503 TaxID=1121345 RepID=A0A1M7Y9I0_9FIRM|nr:phosphate ABC transporter permease PstA [Anaerocolumna xylanovorans]SHO49293.1 phosphate ABC transporter membrane protein 2, PhoT family [Anaerocolumna xylanovorans DSM 12503]